MKLVSKVVVSRVVYILIFLFVSNHTIQSAVSKPEVMPSTSLAPQLELARATDRAEVQKSDKELRRKHYPIIVFVPGVFGSRLFQGNEEIWGRVEARLTPRNLFYNPTGPKAKAEILDKLDASYFTQQIYGNTLTYIRDLQLSDLVTLKLFPYDWRQDNGLSADELNAFLCDPREDFNKRKIIFLAHSMGGLIVKKWIKNYYQNPTCAKTNVNLNIERVVFLGTPHLGAPKSISAFADGFTLLTNSRSVFGSIFGDFDKKTIAESLNKYGASFPSAYQLLPIYQSKRCDKFPIIQGLPFPVTYEDETPTTDVELFDASTWKRLGWPKTLPPGWDRDAFYRDKLPGFLDAATKFLCDVAYYRLEQAYPAIKTTYVIGENSAPDTEAGYLIKAEKDRYGKITLRFAVSNNGGYMSGDGTVPSHIAANRWETDDIRHAEATHQDLLNAKEVKYFVKTIFAHAKTLYENEAFAGQFRQAYVDHYVANRILATYPRDANESDLGQYRAIADANKEIMSRLNLSASNVFEIAQAIEAEDQKADLLTAVAGTGGLEPLQLAWTFDTLASLEAKNGNPLLAASYGGRTTALAWTLSDPVQRTVLLNSAARYQGQPIAGLPMPSGGTAMPLQYPFGDGRTPLVWRPQYRLMPAERPSDLIADR